MLGLLYPILDETYTLSNNSKICSWWDLVKKIAIEINYNDICEKCEQKFSFWENSFTIFEDIPWNNKRCFECPCSECVNESHELPEFISMYELLETEKDNWKFQTRCGHIVNLLDVITKFA